MIRIQVVCGEDATRHDQTWSFQSWDLLLRHPAHLGHWTLRHLVLLDGKWWRKEMQKHSCGTVWQSCPYFDRHASVWQMD